VADRLVLPVQDLAALVTGEVIVAFAPRHEVDLNDELELIAGRPRATSELSGAPAGPATSGLIPDDVSGLVVGLQPATSLGGPEGTDLHILSEVPVGDAVILRVFVGNEPVLADHEFENRRAAVEAMFG
jgi:hypothetical protein